jgi:hypothetical protein
MIPAATLQFGTLGVREISFGKAYPVKVRERRGDEVRTEQGGGWIGWAMYVGAKGGP